MHFCKKKKGLVNCICVYKPCPTIPYGMIQSHYSILSHDTLHHCLSSNNDLKNCDSSLHKMIGCFNHWVGYLWLQTTWGDSGYEMFILANCISSLNPNHTLQLTSSNIYDYDYTSKQDVIMRSCSKIWCFCGDSMFSGFYICKIMGWLLDALWYKQLWSFQMFSSYYLHQQDPSCKIVWGASSVVVLCN